MRLDRWQHFSLEIKKVNKDYSKIVKTFESKTGKENFTYPATNRRVKLYLVKYKNEIVYVGITAQPIVNRLRSGLKPNIKNGYYGYRWKHLKHVDLMVWCDQGHDKPNKSKLKKDMKVFETIEGEIVYLFRKYNGKWPEYQIEIHFHNISEQEKIMAKFIYSKASKII